MNKNLHSMSGRMVLRLSVMMLMIFACVGMMQAQTALTSFTHSTGRFRTEKENNKYSTTRYEQQAVHEDWEVVYSTATTINLVYKNSAFKSYVRWFNYATDGTMSGLTTAETAQYNGNYGLFKMSTGNNVSGFKASYVYNGTSHVYIGCDQSEYGDFTPAAALKEGTLSQRLVYDIRPAKDMATKVDAATGNNWLEEYTMIAPAGRKISIGPKYGYASDAPYPNYYYGASAPVHMIGSSTPTATESSSNVSYQYNNSNHTSAPADTDLSYSGNGNTKKATYTKTETITLTTVTPGGNWSWCEDGSVMTTQPTVTSGQYAEFTSDNVGNVVYTLIYTAGGTRTLVQTFTRTTTYTVTRKSSGGFNSSYTYTTTADDPDDGEKTTISDTTTGAATTYNIAKFTVKYSDIQKVGPYYNIADTAVLKTADMLARQDFNFGASGLSGHEYYPSPLSAEESTFGFYDGDSTGHVVSKYTHFNEYSFVNDGFGYASAPAFANHSGATTGTSSSTGYALYTDGSQKAGTVFALNFSATLCPGAVMYFSAYVGDQNSGSNTHPILDFIVTGIKANGDEENITIYTTGEITGNKQWERIFFPITFEEEVDYVKYKLKVINKAANTTGNDFFIDDIAVYLKPAPIQPIEASSANECLDDNSALTLYTRYDYARANESTSGTTDLYYRWLDYNGDIIETDLYYGATNGNKNGYISINQNYLAIPAADTVESFERFDALYRTTLVPVAKYVWEEDLKALSNDNTARYVLYIATPITVRLGNDYTCKIANAEFELNKKNSCSNSAEITVSNGMRINSVAGGGMVKGLRKTICANYSYDLTVVMEYAVVSGNTTVTDRSPYVAHWLFGLDADVDADFAAEGTKGLYGADFETIKAAVKAYKTADITEEQTKLLNRLVQKGLLQLCKYNADGTPVLSDTTYFVMPLNGELELSYTAFPVMKVKSNAPDCNSPQSITLLFPEGSNLPERNVITFVKNYNETVPTFVSARPRRVRIIEGTTEKNVKIELSNTEHTYVFGKVSLYKTDDDTYTGATVPTVTPVVTPVKGTGLSVNFEGLGFMKANHSYTFKVLYNLAEGEDDSNACNDDKNAVLHDGEAYITFLIVPKLLTFTGDAIASAWNDDYNWTYGENTATFVPLPETSIMFEEGDHILFDKTYAKFQESALEPGALPYISYDIDYAAYTCNNVYVPAGTALPGHTNVTAVGTWTFDMPVQGNKWVMTSMPVQGIVSGDMFIPKDGEAAIEYNKETGKFVVAEMNQTSGQWAADREVYSFYNSMYNQSVVNADVNVAYDITSSTWSFATNSLTTQFPAGFGWSLGFDNAAQDKFIRLPKNESVYHYFRNDTWTGYTEDVSGLRGANYGKPAFTGDTELTLTNNAAGNVFVLGNPTFAYLDLAALAEANKGVIESTFYLSGLTKSSRYDHATGKVVAGDWYTTNGTVAGYLEPMHAVLVVKKGNADTSLKIKITKDMLVTSDGRKETVATTEPEVETTETTETTDAPRRVAARSNEKAIYIKAETSSFTSTALLLENEDASNACDNAEDAEVFLLDKGKTPFAVYTVADGKALAINQIADLSIVPLGFYSQKEVSSEKIEFTGNDAYLSEWDLVDNATGTREILSDGFNTTLQMANNGVIRYYLEHARKGIYSSDPGNGNLSNEIHAYSHEGQLTVYSADDMTDFCLYDAAGRLIASTANAGRIQQFNLNTGVYVVRTSGNVAKVVVK